MMEYIVCVHVYSVTHLMSVLQACQYVISEEAYYPLGRFDKNTTWEIVTLAPPDAFEFNITYRDGLERR